MLASPLVRRPNRTVLLQPYKVSAWDTIPDSLKDPEGYWYGDYYGVMSFEVNTSIVKNPPQDWTDLLKSDYKGQVALAGDPRTSSQAINAVYAAALACGGSADNAEPGLDFFAKLNSAGNFVPVIAKQGTIAQGETPIVIRWDYLALGDRDSLKGNPDIQVSVPRRAFWAVSTCRRSVPSRQHPNAASCGWSTCTRTKASSSGCRAMAIPFDTTTWSAVKQFRLIWRPSFRPLTSTPRRSLRPTTS